MSDLRQKLNLLPVNSGQKRKLDENENSSSVKRTRSESSLPPHSNFHNHTHNHKYKRYFEEDNLLCGQECFEFYYGRESPFSPQHPAEFTVEDKQFKSLEHYCVYRMAVLFNNKDIEEQILKADKPEEHKLLGEQIKDFEFDTWIPHSVDVIKQGNMAKFSQNSELKKQLFATSPRLIAEADPTDNTWGIGLHQDDPQARDMRTWRGENLLGFTITEVREELMRQEEQKEGIEERAEKEKKLGIGLISNKDSLHSRLKKMKKNKKNEKGREMSPDVCDSEMNSSGTGEEGSQQKQQRTKTGSMDRRDSDNEKLDRGPGYKTDSSRRRNSERHRRGDSHSKRRESESYWEDRSFDSKWKHGGRRDGRGRYRSESYGFGRTHNPDDLRSQVMRRRSESCMPRVTPYFSNHNHVYKHYFEEENLVTGHDNMELFFGYQSPFSQHHPAKFVIDEKEFNCAEQYYMYNKAVLFKDKEIADQIMNSSDPKEQKRLGKMTKNFDHRTWMQHSIAIVRRGNLAKFSQNAHLKEHLFATFPRLMVEASPQDKTWGIGLHQGDPLAWNMRTWRGENFLGFTITEVREELMRREPDLEKKVEEWKEKKQNERRTIGERVQSEDCQGAHSEDWDKDLIKVDRYDSTMGQGRMRITDEWDAASYTKRWDNVNYGQRRRSGSRWDQDGDRSSHFFPPSKQSRRYSMPPKVYPKIVNHDHVYKHHFDEKNLINGRENFEFFFGYQSPFSQHHPVKFVIDEKEFNCAEQYYMYNKAVLFKDKEIEEQIMRSDDPKAQKRLGRQIENFDFHTWMQHSVQVVKRGNMAKFSQNDHLKMQLFATAPKLLVEASPGDCTWGIGLSGEDPDAWDMRTWRGENILGFTITEVREELMREEELMKKEELVRKEEQGDKEESEKDKTASVSGTQNCKNFDSEESDSHIKSSGQGSKISDQDSELRERGSEKIGSKKSVSHQKKPAHGRMDSVKEDKMKSDRSDSEDIEKRETDDLGWELVRKRKRERNKRYKSAVVTYTSDSGDSLKGTLDHMRKDTKTNRTNDVRSDYKHESSCSPCSDSHISYHSRDSEDSQKDMKSSHHKKKESERCRRKQKRRKKDESRSKSSNESENDITDKERPIISTSSGENSSTGKKTKQDKNRNVLSGNRSDMDSEFSDHQTSKKEKPSDENRRESKPTSHEMYKTETGNESDTRKNHDEGRHVTENDGDEKSRLEMGGPDMTDLGEPNSDVQDEELHQVEEPSINQRNKDLNTDPASQQGGRHTAGKEESNCDEDVCKQDEEKICEDEQEEKLKVKLSESYRELCNTTLGDVEKDEFETYGMFKKKEKEFMKKISKRNYRVSKGSTKDSEGEASEPKRQRDRDSKTYHTKHDGKASQKDKLDRNESSYSSHRRDSSHRTGSENKMDDVDQEDRKYQLDKKDRLSKSRNDHISPQKYSVDRPVSRYGSEKSNSRDNSGMEGRRYSEGSYHSRGSVDWSQSRNRKDSVGREHRRYSVGSVERKDREGRFRSRSRKDSVGSGRHSDKNIHRKCSADRHHSKPRKDSVEEKDKQNKFSEASVDVKESASVKDSTCRKDSVEKRDKKHCSHSKNGFDMKGDTDREKHVDRKSPERKNSKVRTSRQMTDEDADDVFVSEADHVNRKRHRQTSMEESADDCPAKRPRKERKTEGRKGKLKKSKEKKNKNKKVKKETKKRKDSWSSRSVSQDMKDNESMEIGECDVEEKNELEDSKVYQKRNLRKKKKTVKKKKKKGKKSDESYSN